MSVLDTEVDGSNPGSSMLFPWAIHFIHIASVDSAVKWVPGGDNLVKDVQCYELFGRIALKNHAFSFFISMLFLLYINDMNNAITFQIKLFADDSVLYRNIHNQNYQVIPEDDLDAISSWAEKWLMELNINKCSVLSITLKRNSIFYYYNILGAMHKRVTNHDYLGVTISSDLNWLRHVTKIYNKASQNPWFT